MEINREKFRVAALLIALANTGAGCIVRTSHVNVREETTPWTGSAPAPTYTPGPTSESYPPPGYYPPVNEYGGPSYEYYGPPAEEYYPPPQEYYPPVE